MPRHDKIIEVFGGKGFHCETPAQLRKALIICLKAEQSTLINVAIAPGATRAAQSHFWLTR